jgi:tetratricopeptide (TPR) repeat protein
MMSLLLSSLLLLVAAPAAEEVDPLALAALLLKDGHADRASAVLQEVDPKSETLDQPKYFFLRGLIEADQGRFKEAARSFQGSVRAIRASPEHSADPRLRDLHVLWAQAHQQAGESAEAVAALDAAGPLLAQSTEADLLRGVAERSRGRTTEAWTALRRGRTRAPDHLELLRQQVSLAIEVGLFETSRGPIAELLGHPGATAEDALLIAQSLRAAKQMLLAAEVLERARLRFSGRAIETQLARAYLEGGWTDTAGALLRRAVLAVDPGLAPDAAEVLRRAGKTRAALEVNGLVGDQKSKVRQRLGLLIELERFEEAAALAPRISRLGLLAEEPIAYALAYAEFRGGRYGLAESRLSKIQDPDLFAKAAELRRAIEACTRPEAWCD